MPVHVVQEDTGIQCEGVQGSTPGHQGRERTLNCLEILLVSALLLEGASLAQGG